MYGEWLLFKNPYLTYVIFASTLSTKNITDAKTQGKKPRVDSGFQVGRGADVNMKSCKTIGK